MKERKYKPSTNSSFQELLFCWSWDFLFHRIFLLTCQRSHYDSTAGSFFLAQGQERKWGMANPPEWVFSSRVMLLPTRLAFVYFSVLKYLPFCILSKNFSYSKWKRKALQGSLHSTMPAVQRCLVSKRPKVEITHCPSQIEGTNCDIFMAWHIIWHWEWTNYSNISESHIIFIVYWWLSLKPNF